MCDFIRIESVNKVVCFKSLFFAYFCPKNVSILEYIAFSTQSVGSLLNVKVFLSLGIFFYFCVNFAKWIVVFVEVLQRSMMLVSRDCTKLL